MAAAFGEPTLGFYTSKRLMNKVGSVAEVAQVIQCDVGVLRTTMADYAREVPDAFGRRVFPRAVDVESTAYYVAAVTPVVHYTMGGVAVDKRARVLKDGDGGVVIEGLYAAGEAAGGVHGANRLGGNSLLECAVYGRVAGQEAAAWACRGKHGGGG